MPAFPLTELQFVLSHTNLVKGAAKKRKLVAESASSTSQQPGPIENKNNMGTECWENYFLTKKKDDWIQCSSCQKWLHESCTMYAPHCNNCGRDILREKNKK